MIVALPGLFSYLLYSQSYLSVQADKIICLSLLTRRFAEGVYEKQIFPNCIHTQTNLDCLC